MVKIEITRIDRSQATGHHEQCKCTRNSKDFAYPEIGQFFTSSKIVQISRTAPFLSSEPLSQPKQATPESPQFTQTESTRINPNQTNSDSSRIRFRHNPNAGSISYPLPVFADLCARRSATFDFDQPLSLWLTSPSSEATTRFWCS